MNPHEIKQIGPYPVRRFVAEGGMAWVFEVTDPRFDARRALKMLKPAAGAGQQFQRFEAEARLLAQIAHPSLINIFDFGTDEPTGCHYYTMTYVGGENLSQAKPIEVDRAGPIFRTVLAALAKLHQAGIVHRDIKPSNIMLDEDGHALLGDLGIARTQDSSQAGLTATNVAIGTFLYMSPEQAEGRPVGAASDVFSMGLTIYEVITGVSVYDEIDDVDSTSGQSVLFYLGGLKRAGQQLELRSEKSIPTQIRRVIKKACRFDPDDRYPDGAAMLHAWENALAESARGGSGAPGWALPAAGAVAAAAIAGIALLFWSQSSGRASVGEELANVSVLEQQALSIVEDAEVLGDQAPDAKLLDEARQELRLASTFLRKAQSDFEADSADLAASSLTLARQGYERACSDLYDAHLAKLAGHEGAGATRLAEDLRKVGAQEMAPEAWADLDSKLTALAALGEEGAPCDLAATALDRRSIGATALAAALAVEQSIASELPRLTTGARADAEDAWQVAVDYEVGAPAFQTPLGEGRDLLDLGDELERDGDLVAARNTYRDAEAAFLRAAAVAPAAHAWVEARALLDQTKSAGVPAPEVVKRMLSEATDHYEQERWSDAEDRFVSASAVLRSLLADAEKSRAALIAGAKADAAREAALAQGAERAAAGEIARADRLRSEAEGALQEKQYRDATRSYERAATAYAAAGKQAGALSSDARKARSSAERAIASLGQAGRCDSLGEAAQAACEEARAALTAGNAALESADSPSALASYRNAEDLAARATDAQRAYERGLQRPPTLVRRSPTGQRVSAYRNETVRLTVEATDPNGDALKYRWKSERGAVQARGNQVELRADRDTRVTVEVVDGKGGAFQASWDVEIRNRKPRVAFSGKPPSGALQVGKTYTFEVAASDPDGESVDTEFLLDGKRVGRGKSFRFEPAKAGTYRLAVRATDASGARAEIDRRLTVEAQRVAAVPPAPPTPAALDPGQVARATLAEYAKAYESRDIERLSRVWQMSAAQRRNTEVFFGATSSIDMDIQQGSAREGGDDRVTVDFDQRVKAPGIPNAPAAMTATLVQADAGRWVIESIRAR